MGPYAALQATSVRRLRVGRQVSRTGLGTRLCVPRFAGAAWQPVLVPSTPFVSDGSRLLRGAEPQLRPPSRSVGGRLPPAVSCSLLEGSRSRVSGPTAPQLISTPRVVGSRGSDGCSQATLLHDLGDPFHAPGRPTRAACRSWPDSVTGASGLSRCPPHRLTRSSQTRLENLPRAYKRRSAKAPRVSTSDSYRTTPRLLPSSNICSIITT